MTWWEWYLLGLGSGTVAAALAGLLALGLCLAAATGDELEPGCRR